MREVCLGVLVLCAATTQARVQEGKTSAILAEARNALGGNTALNAIRSLRMTGAASRTLGPLRVAGDVVIEVVFPDRYVRVDRVSLGARSSEMATGFNGGRLIQRATGADGVRVEPAAMLPPELKARGLQSALASARQDVGLLLLGFFCSASDIYPVQFAHSGSAESPDGTADVVDVLGDDGLMARLFIDTTTRLPLMVSWMGPNVTAAMRSQSRAEPGAEPASLETLMTRLQVPVEHRLYFADYRPVGALKWPFRIRRSVGGEVIEELTFERFAVNPAVDPRTFDPER